MNYLKKIFSLDLRSLALFRALLGLTLLFDMISRFSMRHDFYSDLGTLSREVLFERVEVPWKMSLLSLNGSPTFAGILAIIGMITALAMILGKHTRFSTLVGWLILASFHARNPLVAHGGDNVLRMLLFWAFFLPLGAKWSLDAQNLKYKTTQYFSPFTVAISLQVLFIYIFTFFYKWDPSWLSELDSFYYAMNLSMFTTPIGDYLLNFPTLLKVMTFLTLWLEGLGPLLFLSTHRYARRAMVIAFLGLHIGIELTMVLGLFPMACFTAWTLFVDTDFMNKVEIKISSLSLNIPKYWSDYQNNFLAPFDRVNFTGLKSKLMASFLVLLVFGWNLEGMRVFSNFDIKSPFKEIVFSLQLNQQWNMFAPSPMRGDGYFVIEGHLKDNEFVDPMTGKRPLMNTPENFASTYKNTAWNKYLLNIYSQNWSNQRLYFGKYLCRKWNSEHPSSRYLNRFKIYFMRDMTPAPGAAKNPLEKIEIWHHNCFPGKSA